MLRPFLIIYARWILFKKAPRVLSRQFMKVRVKVRARAKENRVELTEDGSYKIWVKAVPENGKANQAIIHVLSEFLNIQKARISIHSGHTSSQKVLEII